jgi:hypothetical protein
MKNKKNMKIAVLGTGMVGNAIATLILGTSLAHAGWRCGCPSGCVFTEKSAIRISICGL